MEKNKKRYLDCKYLDAGMDGMLCSMDLCTTCKRFNGENCSNYVSKDEIKRKYILANKCYSDATLKSMTKNDLIEHIRILEHNWAGAVESLNNQSNYLRDKVVLDKEELNMLIGNIEKSSEIKAEELEKVRKETASEILQTIKSYDGWNELQRLRDEIAKQYGVEVE